MIGQYKHRITFYNPTVSKSSTGGTTEAYASFATVWAKAEQARNGYNNEGAQPGLKKDYVFYVRSSSEIDDNLNAQTLISYKSNYYSVNGIEKIEEENFYYKINAVRSLISVEVIDPGTGESGGGVIDMSHLKFTFVVTGTGTAILTILKNTLIDESLVIWGDGDQDVIAAGGSIAISHEYEEGTFECKVYPFNGLTTPTAQAVNIIESINVVKVVEGENEMTMTVGNSLSKCDFLKFFEAQDWGMTTFPTLPNAGLEQVRTVNIPGNLLPSAYCSNVFVQLDEIDWPVGYIDLTDSPGAGSLSAAGLIAKQNLTNKGWEIHV